MTVTPTNPAPGEGPRPEAYGSPSTVDELAFRRTLGHLATGVTVVTTWGPAGVHGLTANAITSLSLRPPLILMCIDRRSRTLGHLRTEGAFAVNLLRQTQEPLSRYFARSWHAPEPPEHRFEDWAGVPYLIGSLGALSCRVAEVLEGGDHLIVTGRVVGMRIDKPTGRPLLFYRGQYAGLVPHDTSVPEAPELISSDQIRVYYGEWMPEDEERRPPVHPWFP